MKLFRVATTVKEYRGCKDVRLAWFRHPDDDFLAYHEPRPYAELIDGYDPDNEFAVYPRGAVDELFTVIEAEVLKEYLDTFEGATTIEEVHLPVPHDTMGLGAKSVEGGDGFYMLDQRPEYALSFGVWGYYDLVGCELVDAPGSNYRHRLWQVTFRMETNEEAAFRDQVSASGKAQGRRDDRKRRLRA